MFWRKTKLGDKRLKFGWPVKAAGTDTLVCVFVCVRSSDPGLCEGKPFFLPLELVRDWVLDMRNSVGRVCVSVVQRSSAPASCSPHAEQPV